ncbi:MAG: hypothetical protein R3298_00945 [Gammaproteobacteria bacterium]|nr:hypothetical protein [Gammaproteobacteria bacterium]
MRILAIVFAAAMLLIAAGILVRPGDPRLARVLFILAGLLGLLLAGGFFGLIGDG